MTNNTNTSASISAYQMKRVLRLIEGEKEKSPTEEITPPPDMEGVPPPFPWLDNDAKEIYYSIAPGMFKDGRLSPGLRQLLVSFCIKMALAKQAYQILKDEGWVVPSSTGTGMPKRHPCAIELDCAISEARLLAQTLFKGTNGGYSSESEWDQSLLA